MINVVRHRCCTPPIQIAVVVGLLLTGLVGIALADPVAAERQMENLGRGVVAVSQGDGKVYVGWRMLGTDPDDIAFNLYRTTGARDSVKLNDQPPHVGFYLGVGMAPPPHSLIKTQPTKMVADERDSVR